MLTAEFSVKLGFVLFGKAHGHLLDCLLPNLGPSAGLDLLVMLVSLHVVSVAACVIHHAMGLTDAQIMCLLRWNSNAFMTSLLGQRRCPFQPTEHCFL